MANKLFDRFRKNAGSGEKEPEQELEKELRGADEDPGEPETDGAGGADGDSSAQSEKASGKSGETKRREDVELLLSLFPKLNVSAVPDEVWDRVRDGDSLSAAYCLWLVKTVKEKQRIDGVNSKNTRAAIPAMTDDSSREGFFTRDTVRNMTREQIRKNLDGILRSMDSWK